MKIAAVKGLQTGLLLLSNTLLAVSLSARPIQESINTLSVDHYLNDKAIEQ